MNQNNFHFLRFFAAALVMYGHAYPLTGRGNLDKIQELSLGVFPTAHMGVCIFFTISGYLIAKSLLSSSSSFNYLWKRLLRLIPGLTIATLFTILIVGPLATTFSLREYFTAPATFNYIKVLKLFPPYIDILPGVFTNQPSSNVNGSLWTLSYEFTCYIALLLTCIFFRRHYKTILLVVFIIIWSTFPFWQDFLSSLSHTTMPVLKLQLNDLLNFGLYFLGGSVMFLYRDKIHYSLRYLLVLVFLLILSYLLSSTWGILPLSIIFWIRYLVIIYGVLYFGLSKGLLNHFESIGDLSYGLYIYAYPVQQLLVHFLGIDASPFSMFVLTMLMTIPLAWLSWKFVEEPSLRLKSLVK